MLNGATQASNVQQQASDGLVADRRSRRTTNAIGYVGLAHSGKGSGIKKLTVNGVACNAANIKTENYPLSRFIWGGVADGQPERQAEKFFDWVRTSKGAGQDHRQVGRGPAFNKSANRERPIPGPDGRARSSTRAEPG